jgi:hypothetical protein
MPQIKALQKSILETSYETETPIKVSGVLVGYDSNLRRFHFKTTEGADMKRETSPRIGTKETLEVQESYALSVLTRRKIHYATEQEEVTYYILYVK